MDRLATCMDALRVLAKSTDPSRAKITTETVSVWHALEQLGKAIRDEHAEPAGGRELEHSERVCSLGAA